MVIQKGDIFKSGANTIVLPVVINQELFNYLKTKVDIQLLKTIHRDWAENRLKCGTFYFYNIKLDKHIIIIPLKNYNDHKKCAEYISMASELIVEYSTRIKFGSMAIPQIRFPLKSKIKRYYLLPEDVTLNMM